MAVLKTFGGKQYALVAGRRGIRYVPAGVPDEDAPAVAMTSATEVSDAEYSITGTVTDDNPDKLFYSLDGGTTWIEMNEVV